MTEKVVEILLVEDNPHDVELTLRALKKHRITNAIHVVRDGPEALDFLFARGTYANRQGLRLPKIVLLDLKLPKLSGIEVLRQLRADPALDDTPVVVLTSSREHSDIEECYRLHVNSYIVKPVDFQQFTEAVRQLGLYWVLLNEPPVGGSKS